MPRQLPTAGGGAGKFLSNYSAGIAILGPSNNCHSSSRDEAQISKMLLDSKGRDNEVCTSTSEAG